MRRLLRGEDLETVSRSLSVTAATLSGWREAFLAAGEAALSAKPCSGEELESERLKAKLGAALIKRDLLHEKIAFWRPTALWPAEARAMSEAVSPVSGRRYGLATVCRVWRVARSGVYRHLTPPPATPPGRPGPVGPMPDGALLAAIRGVLAASPFHGEGHRKVSPAARRRHPHRSAARAPADAGERVIGPEPGWIGARTAGA